MHFAINLQKRCLVIILRVILTRKKNLKGKEKFFVLLVFQRALRISNLFNCGSLYIGLNKCGEGKGINFLYLCHLHPYRAYSRDRRWTLLNTKKVAKEAKKSPDRLTRFTNTY